MKLNSPAFASYCRDMMTSGAIYWNNSESISVAQTSVDCKLTMGDPHKVAAMFPSWRNLANPKSAIFSVMFDGDGKLLPQPCDSKMFCGFRSLCTMPLAKRALIAPAKITNKLERTSRWNILTQQSYRVEREKFWWCLHSVCLWLSDSQRDHRRCSTPWRDKRCAATPCNPTAPRHFHDAAQSAPWVFWFLCREGFATLPSSSWWCSL